MLKPYQVITIAYSIKTPSPPSPSPPKGRGKSQIVFTALAPLGQGGPALRDRVRALLGGNSRSLGVMILLRRAKDLI
jgi:hypothetical protein